MCWYVRVRFIMYTTLICVPQQRHFRPTIRNSYLCATAAALPPNYSDDVLGFSVGFDRLIDDAFFQA